MKKINNIILYSFIILISYLNAQALRPNSLQKELIRQYRVSFYTIADTNSDSIRVLSYLSVPNNVLQFIKNNQNFEAGYEATISIKEKKGSQVGRKNWVNKLITDKYLESISRKIYTIHFAEFKVPVGSYIISTELLDKDSNNSGLRSKELNLSKKNGEIEIYSTFFVDYLAGNWGLNVNEIPLFQNFHSDKIIRPTVFISGKV